MRRGLPGSGKEAEIGGGSWVLCGSAGPAERGAQGAGGSGDPFTPHTVSQKKSHSPQERLWRPAPRARAPMLWAGCLLNPSHAGQGWGPLTTGAGRPLALTRGRCLQAGGRARPGGAPPGLAVQGPWRTGPGCPWLHQTPLWGSNRACSAQPHSLQMNALPESPRGFRDSVQCPSSCCWLVRGRSVGNLEPLALPTGPQDVGGAHSWPRRARIRAHARDEAVPQGLRPRQRPPSARRGLVAPGEPSCVSCGGWCLVRGLRRARRTGLRGFRGEPGR